MNAHNRSQVILVVTTLLLELALWFAVVGFGADPLDALWFFVGAIIYALITFEIFCWRGRRLNIWFGLLYLVIWGALSVVVTGLTQSSMSYLQTQESGSTWLLQIVAGMFGGLSVSAMIRPLLITGLAYYLARRQVQGKASTSEAPLSSSIYRQPTADAAHSPTTYHLAASLLSDRGLRRAITQMVEEERKSLAPEPGIDFPRLARLTYLLNARDHRYDLYYLLPALVGLPLLTILLAGETSGIVMLGFVATIVSAMVIYFVDRNEIETVFVPLLNAETRDLDQLEQRLMKSYPLKMPNKPLPGPDQNVVVYSGFVPYAGAGIALDGWTLLIDVTRPKEGRPDVRPFGLKEVYAAIERQVQHSAFPAQSAQDLVFVNGQEIRDESWVLPDYRAAPLNVIDEANAAVVMAQKPDLARRYRWLQVRDWGNQLVVSFYLRASRSSQYLFVESKPFVLTPLQEKYLQTRDPAESRTRAQLGLLLKSLYMGPVRATVGAFAILGRGLERLMKLDPFGWTRRAKEKEMRENRKFDYGAQGSLRTWASAGRYGQYFQGLDQLRIVKVVEKQVIEGLIAFLEAHDIDTSDLREQRKIILNEGVVVQGGSLRAGAVAVGSKAEVALQNTQAA